MSRARAPWSVLAAIGLAVPGLHAALLLAWTTAVREPGIVPPSAVPSLQVRSLPFAQRDEPTAVPAQSAARDERQATRPAARRDFAKPPARTETSTDAAATPGATPSSTSSTPDAAPPAAPAQTRELAVPVYATQLPAPGRWRYRMTRGAASGEAELAYSLDASEAAGYVLQLEGRVAGAAVLEWASRGQIDAAGLAPDRFALRRRGRDRQAANFQREAGKITFSGPTHEQALPPGAQDRLSWLVQLPAIVAAAPERFVAGASVVLFVAGARGDADLWTFVVAGREMQGDIETLKLVREPQKPYDTRAEIWLDPARQFLPQRVQQTPSGGGAALDLVHEPVAP